MNPRDYTPSQRRNGGLKRYATARIHPTYRIFLPDHPVDGLEDNLFPSTYHHGQAGGQARAIKAVRDTRGRFMKVS